MKQRIPGMVEESYQGHFSDPSICSCEHWVGYLTCSIAMAFTKIEATGCYCTSTCYFMFYRHISLDILCYTLSFHLYSNNKYHKNCVWLVGGLAVISDFLAPTKISKQNCFSNTFSSHIVILSFYVLL